MHLGEAIGATPGGFGVFDIGHLAGEPLDYFNPIATLAAITNRQSRRRAFDVARAHYDAGNDLFARMLDPNLVYTCGYWREADDLASAQIAKLDLVCRKLRLRRGETVVVGGWGGGALALHMARDDGGGGKAFGVSREAMVPPM